MDTYDSYGGVRSGSIRVMVGWWWNGAGSNSQVAFRILEAREPQSSNPVALIDFG